MRSNLLRILCGVGALSLGSVTAQTYTESVLHNFASAPKGAAPNAGLIRDSAGNLYGTAETGGAENLGVVFKLTPAGKLTVLHSFTGGTDGQGPASPLARDASGNLYGTTSYGGIANAGVVFKIGPTGTETIVYSFTGGMDGRSPGSGVIRDSAGNLYGTAVGGGASNGGVIFKITPAGTESVLFNFTESQGASPQALIRDSDGNFFGTTAYGGSEFDGVIFKYSAIGQFSVLYNFTGGYDGWSPNTGIVEDAAGNLYGTTNSGGSSYSGTLWEYSASGLSVLHAFSGGADGGYPNSGVVMDSSGVLYGATQFGGLKTGYAGSGVVYRFAPGGPETVLFTFPGGGSGAQPAGVVALDSSGNLYGAATSGGPALLGLVYEVSSSGTETTLYSFAGPVDGSTPQTGVIRDSSGNFYGVTYTGGADNRGVVYKIGASGTEKILHTFTGGADGGTPYGQLLRDSSGNLYGTTEAGGNYGAGTVFEITAAGEETVLYHFTGGDDGSGPEGGLVRDAAGNFYGTTAYGGGGNCFSGCGVVFKLTPAGVETVLSAFNGTAGAYPRGTLSRDAAGNLYGITNGGGPDSAGTVFKVTAAGVESVLYPFTGHADGGSPYGLLLDSSGNLYGTTATGGVDYGTVFKVSATGQETVLYNFTGKDDGGFPYAGVILDASGNLYGTTSYGGTYAKGVAYKLTPGGQQTVLYNFTGGVDGGQPYASLLEDSSGDLYGTTFGGGAQNAGVLFKLTP